MQLSDWLLGRDSDDLVIVRRIRVLLWWGAWAAVIGPGAEARAAVAPTTLTPPTDATIAVASTAHETARRPANRRALVQSR